MQLALRLTEQINGGFCVTRQSKMKKMCIKKSFVVSVFVVGLELVLSGQLEAQTFTNLYNFTGGSDGRTPVSMVLSGNVLFGATFRGGLSGSGSLFTVNTDG